MENNFFGSKFYNSRLNTILLFVLIILMVVALIFMFKNKETYMPYLNNGSEKQSVNKNVYSSKDNSNNDEFIKENILGIWAQKGEINSNFRIDKDNIIYTDEKNGKYPYYIKNGYIIIQEQDYENSHLVKIPENGILILENSAGEQSIFYTFQD